MIKRIISIAVTAICAIAAHPMPAHPAPATVIQPDGTSLTVRLHGDEFMHYTTTIDGYTVIRDDSGTYRYAVRRGELLVAGNVTAHNPDDRSATETDYISGIGKIIPTTLGDIERQMKMARLSGETGLRHGAPHYDYRNFRGLVVLVEYSDCRFSMNDPLTRFGDMVSKRNYTGFTPDNGFFHEEYTGSVTDYFYDNSFGHFEPEFDIAGPVTITKSQYYVNGNDNIREVIKEAMDLIDPSVDFSLYDGDGDGTVDMFYVIFAGGGSNFSGNDPRLVWPHAWNMAGNIYDGVALGRYACSTELYGPPSWNMCDGIGTICHEFSHVLGLMDEYDTDYEGSGGQSDHPGEWSLMASGGYLNNARTPTGYSLIQRYQSGFCIPEVIDQGGEYVLEDIDLINNGFRINTSDSREYFLLENKRKDNKWNKYNAGEGMLIHRVDSTNTVVWTNNKINADPSHSYYLLVRAVRKANSNGIVDHDGDPFPGSYGITSIDYNTDPALVAWSGKGAALVLSDIRENPDGSISFSATEQKMCELLEDFESVVTEGKYDMNVPGSFCDWTFYNGIVDTPGEPWCDGGNAAGIFKNGYLQSSVIEGHTNAISMTVSNPTSRPVTFNVRYNTGGNNWDYLYEPGGLAGIALASLESKSYRFDIPTDYRDNLKIQMRLANSSGSTTDKVYFDNISALQDIPTSVVVSDMDPDDALSLTCYGNRVDIDCASGRRIMLCDITGRILATAKKRSTVSFILPAHGCYLITDGITTEKINY